MRTRTRFRRLLLALCGLALLVRAPALIAPPTLDDHVQAAMAEGRFPARRAVWDYYAFARGTAADRAALRAEGTLPWWTDDDYQLVMFRPLASVLVAADHTLLRHWSLARVHSAAWVLAMLLALGAMVRRLSGERAALVAVGLLALDDALTTPLAWHANRCALEAVTLSLVAVSLLVGWVDEGRRRLLALGLVAAALACLCGEYAWTVLPAAALLPRGDPGRRRTVRVALGALAMAYLLVRAGFGAGVRGCVLYPDLVRDLQLLLFVMPHAWASMLADFFSGVSVEQPGRWLGVTASRGTLAAVGATLLLIAWRGAKLDEDANRTRRLALRAGLTSLLVVSTAWLSARLMLGASLWIAVLLGALASATGGSRASRVALTLLMILHGPAKAVETWRGARAHFTATRASWRGADELLEGVPPEASVYVLNAVDPEDVYFGRYTRAARGETPTRGWYVLASTLHRVHVVREGPRVFSLVSAGSVVDGLTARFFRSGGPWPRPGAAIRVGDATLTVINADSAVRRVRVDFDLDLDDPAVALVVSTRAGLRRFTPPAVGASVELAPPRVSPPPR